MRCLVVCCEIFDSHWPVFWRHLVLFCGLFKVDIFVSVIIASLRASAVCNYQIAVEHPIPVVSYS